MDDLAAAALGPLNGLAFGDDGLGVLLGLFQHAAGLLLGLVPQALGLVLGLVQHTLDLAIGLVHILLLGLHQILRLAELCGELGADLVQQVQGFLPVDNAFFGAEGSSPGLVDHAVQHVKELLYVFIFHL